MLLFKFWYHQDLDCFLKNYAHIRLHLFDQKYSQNNKIVLYCFLFEYILKCNVFLWYQSCIFSIITPVFSVTWSFRNHNNIHLHLADAFIQSDLQLHPGYTFSLVCVFPENRTHNLLRCWRNALPLNHTGTYCVEYGICSVWNIYCSRNIICYYQCWKHCAASYFCGNRYACLQYSLINIKFSFYFKMYCDFWSI